MFIVIKKRTVFFFTFFLGVFLAAIAVSPPESLEAAAPIASTARTVVIDAGHGGEDGGAVSQNGVVESTLNLAIAKRTEELLAFLGEKTLMTRTEDVSLHSQDAGTVRSRKASDLKNRTELVNAQENAVLLSIHQNSIPSHPSVHGAQAFYNTVESADVIAASVQSALNTCVNTHKAKTERKIDPSIYLMNKSTAPAVLVECGFLSNAEETALLQKEEHQLLLAFSIAAGFRSAFSDTTEWR